MRASPKISRLLTIVTAVAAATATIVLPASGVRAEASRAMCPGRETVPLATAALRLNRKDPLGYLCRARVFLELRNYRRALTDLSTAIKLKPADSELYVERAQVYLNRDNLNRALTDLNRAIAIKPNARAYRERGVVYAELGDFARALTDVDAALKLQPASSDLYVLRGQFYVGRENFKRAERSVPETQTLETLTPELLPQALRARDAALAQADFEFALKLDARMAEAHYGLALTRRSLAADELGRQPERIKQALTSIEQALQLKPDYLDALLLKAEMLAMKDDMDGAKAVADAAVKALPQAPQAYSYRARLLLDTREYGRALSDALRAIRLDKQLAEPYCVRATVYSETGKRRLALREFNTCLRLAGNREIRDWASDELNALSIPVSMR